MEDTSSCESYFCSSASLLIVLSTDICRINTCCFKKKSSWRLRLILCLPYPPKMGPGSVFGRREAKMSVVSHQSSGPVFLLSRSIPWILNTLTLPFIFLEEPWSSLNQVLVRSTVTVCLSQPMFLAYESQGTSWFTRQFDVTHIHAEL